MNLHIDKTAQLYSEAQTRHWLAFLARNMQQHGQTVFLIEQLQPSWLTTKWQRWVYIITSRLLWGLMTGIILWLLIDVWIVKIVGDLAVNLFLGLFFGISNALTSGLIVGLIVGLIGGLSDLTYYPHPHQASIRQFLIDILIGGVIVGLIIGLITWLINGLIPSEYDRAELLPAGLIFGLILGLISRLRDTRRFIPRRSSSVWSYIKNGIIVVLIGGIRFGLIGGLIGGLALGLPNGLIRGSTIGLYVGLISGLLVWLCSTSLRLRSCLWFIKDVLVFGLSGGLMVGLYSLLNTLYSFEVSPIETLIGGIMLGLFAGLIIGFIVSLIRVWRDATHLTRVSGFMQYIENILFFGLFGALLGRLMNRVDFMNINRLLYFFPDFEHRNAALFSNLEELRPIMSLIVGLMIGVIGGFIWTLRSTQRGSEKEIQTIETVTWSWKNAIKNGLKGLIIGMSFLLMEYLIVGLLIYRVNIPLKDLGLSSVVIIYVGLFVALIGGFIPVVQAMKIKPNQGIRLSIRNGLLGGSFVWLIVVLITGLPYGWLGETRIRVAGIIGLPIDWFFLGNGLAYGGLIGLCAGLWFGGLDALQHGILRLIFYFRGDAPLNYARFLDYAADELNFLQKVGGGYVFIHRYLLEHFAAMEEVGETDQHRTPTNTSASGLSASDVV